MDMKRLLTYLFVCSAVLLTGCASGVKMPLQDDQPLATTAKPVLLTSIDMKNKYKERFQPQVLFVHVFRVTDGKEELIPFQMDSKGLYWGEEDADPLKHFVRFELDPGEYRLQGAYAQARAFPVIGFFYLPLHMQFKVTPETKVTYLGAIQGTVRERQGNEFRAGSVVPLIDQSVAGASGGTFEVAVIDNYDADIKTFKKLFPAIQNVEITRSILPPFDRQKAQAWWEAN